MKRILFYSLILLVPAFSFFSVQTTYARTAEEQAVLYSKMAASFSQKKEYHHALRFINQAIKLQPEKLRFYYQRAFIYGKKTDYGNAINDFSKCILDPKNFPHAVRFRADCYMVLGQYQLAVDDYMAFLKKNPKDGKVWSYLAEAFVLKKDTKNALTACRYGLKAKSHWTKRILILQEKILTGQRITPHKPLTN